MCLRFSRIEIERIGYAELSNAKIRVWEWYNNFLINNKHWAWIKKFNSLEIVIQVICFFFEYSVWAYVIIVLAFSKNLKQLMCVLCEIWWCQKCWRHYGNIATHQNGKHNKKILIHTIQFALVWREPNKNHIKSIA